MGLAQARPGPGWACGPGPGRVWAGSGPGPGRVRVGSRPGLGRLQPTQNQFLPTKIVQKIEKFWSLWGCSGGCRGGVFEHFWTTFGQKFPGPEIDPGGVFFTSGGLQKVSGVVSGAEIEGQFLTMFFLFLYVFTAGQA